MYNSEINHKWLEVGEMPKKHRFLVYELTGTVLFDQITFLYDEDKKMAYWQGKEIDINIDDFRLLRNSSSFMYCFNAGDIFILDKRDTAYISIESVLDSKLGEFFVYENKKADFIPLREKLKTADEDLINSICGFVSSSLEKLLVFNHFYNEMESFVDIILLFPEKFQKGFFIDLTYYIQKDNTNMPVKKARNEKILEICLPFGEEKPSIFFNAACLYAETGELDKIEDMIKKAWKYGLEGFMVLICEVGREDMFKEFTKGKTFREMFGAYTLEKKHLEAVAPGFGSTGEYDYVYMQTIIFYVAAEMYENAMGVINYVLENFGRTGSKRQLQQEMIEYITGENQFSELFQKLKDATDVMERIERMA